MPGDSHLFATVEMLVLRVWRVARDLTRILPTGLVMSGNPVTMDGLGNRGRPCKQILAGGIKQLVVAENR